MKTELYIIGIQALITWKNYSAANAEARRKVLYSMSEKEQEQWESRLDIENMFFYVDIATFTTFNEFYQALLEKDSNEGEVAFDLYQNEEHCRNDDKITFVKNRIFQDGMILKAYIAGFPQTAQPDEPSSPDDVPDILKGYGIDGINGNTTIGELKDRLYFIDRKDITVNEIVLLDPNSKPISTEHSRIMSDEEDLSNAYGIYIEFDYLGETYALEFFSEEIDSLRVFHKGEFALKSEFPLR